MSSQQLDSVKSLIREHLEKNKFFDSLKSAVAKDPRLAQLDKNTLIEKIKSEGILNDILQTIPVQTKRAQTGVGITPLEKQNHVSH